MVNCTLLSNLTGVVWTLLVNIKTQVRF